MLFYSAKQVFVKKELLFLNLDTPKTQNKH